MMIDDDCGCMFVLGRLTGSQAQRLADSSSRQSLQLWTMELLFLVMLVCTLCGLLIGISAASCCCAHRAAHVASFVEPSDNVVPFAFVTQHGSHYHLTPGCPSIKGRRSVKLPVCLHCQKGSSANRKKPVEATRRSLTAED